MEKQENKKTVIEVAKSYQEVTNDAAKKKIVESCGIKTYLPIRDKIRIIDNIVASGLGQIDDDGLASYDGIDSMVYLVLSLIEGYTDLELTEELDDFDALMSSGLGSAILEAIGEDAEVFQDMFEMSLNHFIQEHNTVKAYVGVIVQAILEPLSKWSDVITGFIDDNGGIDNVLKTIQDMQNQLSEL